MLAQQSLWDSLPAKLLLNIINRVEASEITWPSRRAVVSCAAVCKAWRFITREVVRTPEECGLLTFPISLKQPGPRDFQIQCFIRRERATSTYRLYLGLSPALSGDASKLFLAAKRIKKATKTDISISSTANDFSQTSDNYVGKLRSNFFGSNFSSTIVSPQATPLSNPTVGLGTNLRQESGPKAICNYNVATIYYELNFLRTRGPRRMHCTMHSIPVSSIQVNGSDPTPPTFINGLDENFCPLASSASGDRKQNPANTSEPLILKNKTPRWHKQLQCWCLNFRGRVTIALVKNVQLVAEVDPSENIPESEQDRVILQFGKIGKDIFTMDYRYPLSAFQAFAICLSTFDTKPVSIPCTSLFQTVTGRCGHCTDLLLVNMRGLLLPYANQLHLGHSLFGPQTLLEEIRNSPSNMLINQQNPNESFLPVEGGGKKFKPKVVFRQQSMVVRDRHGRSSPDNSTPPDEIGGKADEEMDEFVAESQLIYHDKESEQPENRIVPFEPAHKHDSKGNSMVDFLYNFEESSKQLLVLDSVSPCSDDKENHRNLKLVMPTRTMADQFHEAFGTVDVIDERPHVTFSRPSFNGMYGKLQEAIQSEKERDMGYLNSLSVEPGFKDERMCISVRILTTSLEAKLIVCSCSRVKDGKSLRKMIHPNIVKFKEVIRESDVLYFVFEYMGFGEDLVTCLPFREEVRSPAECGSGPWEVFGAPRPPLTR
ncbi:tubby-like F-box protein 6 [Phtheirospermum japonicum]|uniref:Tubby-like F-box protein 6 n=1 Tax=Phtheirospermum japonicum TaxID=374723 RepID=A0A830BMK4_9LAMI|nr:tubby-like F-box protein 6 [Phtheirospermum japonicum]